MTTKLELLRLRFSCEDACKEYTAALKWRNRFTFPKKLYLKKKINFIIASII